MRGSICWYLIKNQTIRSKFFASLINSRENIKKIQRKTAMEENSFTLYMILNCSYVCIFPQSFLYRWNPAYNCVLCKPTGESPKNVSENVFQSINYTNNHILTHQLLVPFHLKQAIRKFDNHLRRVIWIVPCSETRHSS